MARNRRRRQRGFIILFGYRTVATRDGRDPVQTKCPRCSKETTMVSKRHRPWFTLFFIPVFPLGGGQSICECSSCKARFAVDVEVLRQKMERAATPDAAQAIALHHRALEAPEDSGRLLDLMRMYVAMNAPKEVIAAARCFPRAMLGSAPCHTMLGEAHIQTGERDEALRCFDKALAIDPGNSDAQKARQQMATA